MEDITQSKYLTQEELNSIFKVARKRGERDYAKSTEVYIKEASRDSKD